MVRTKVDRPSEPPPPPPSSPRGEQHHPQSRRQPAAEEPPPRAAPQSQRNPGEPAGTSQSQRNPGEPAETSQHREDQVPQDLEASWQNSPQPEEAQLQNQPVWKQVLCSRAEADCWPNHLRVFRSEAEYRLVRHTHLLLQRCGFYWGPISMENTHHVLSSCDPGAFLIRDSGQPDVFFTLSYRGADGPTSVRVLLTNQLFSLHGSNKTFDSLMGLLAYYTSQAASGKLRRPHRLERPDSLQAVCRRVVHRVYGPHRATNLPGLSNPVRDYLQDYPYDI